jgi:hypothetical protein
MWKRISKIFVSTHSLAGILLFWVIRILRWLGTIDNSTFYQYAITAIGIIAVGLAAKATIDVLELVNRETE